MQEKHKDWGKTDPEKVEQVRAAVEAILKRGNDAVIRRRGDSVIVLEEKRKIIYNPSLNRE